MNQHIVRLQKLVFSLARPRFWRPLRLGVAPGIEHRKALRGLGCATVIDVGANKGQFALTARMLFPRAAVWSFEPLPGESAIFEKALRGFEGVRLIRCGLGSKKDTLEMHLSASSDSSSLLPIGNLQTEVFPGTKAAGVLQVDVRRLDEVLKDSDVVAPALLKIDVQGFELEVLKGAVGLLNKVGHIYVELSERELYRGQPLRGDVETFLKEHGYHAQAHFNDTLFEGALLQADWLFARG